MVILYFLSTSTSDNEQKLIYKRILNGGEIPSSGLQKFSSNNRSKHLEIFLCKKICIDMKLNYAIILIKEGY